MHAIKQIRKYIDQNPARDSSRRLARLAAALAAEREFPLAELYHLDYEAFDLAIDLLKDWRFDRYYAGEINLFASVLNDRARAGTPGGLMGDS